MAGSPSSPTIPKIVITTTDEDIAAHVAQIFRVKYHQVKPRREDAKIPYMVSVKGSTAHDLMRTLYPLMSQRRQTQIDEALANYQYNPHRHLTTEQAKGIKQMLADGHSMRYIASEFGTTYDIVRDIKRGRCYREVEH